MHIQSFTAGKTWLGLATLAVSAFSAQAATFTYTTGDLVAAFRKSGSSDLEVNLGSVSSLKSLAPGSTVNFATGAGAKYDASSQLTATFTDVNNLSFSVIGTQKTTGAGDTQYTSWFTSQRADPLTKTDDPNRFTSSKTQTISGAISGILGDGVTTGALGYAPNASYPPSSATALIIPTTGTAAANSFTTKFTATGSLQGLVPTTPGIENKTDAAFSSTPGALAVSDLYEYQPGSPSLKAIYLGSFSLNNNGELSFTAVPEPGTWGMMAIGGLFLLATQRNRNLKTTASK